MYSIALNCRERTFPLALCCTEKLQIHTLGSKNKQETQLNSSIVKNIIFMYKSSRPKVAALWFLNFWATVEVAQEVKTLCSQSGGREFESLRISSADPSFMAAPYCNNSTVYSMASDRCYFWKYIYRVFISIQHFMLRSTLL